MTDEFDHITTAAHVAMYKASSHIFAGILKEVRELSRKKPDATMSAGKVRIVNRVLKDLLTFLKSEPEGKYLDELDSEALPQMSDAVLIMVQFEKALEEFSLRYRAYVPDLDESTWITKELIAELED